MNRTAGDVGFLSVRWRMLATCFAVRNHTVPLQSGQNRSSEHGYAVTAASSRPSAHSLQSVLPMYGQSFTAHLGPAISPPISTTTCHIVTVLRGVVFTEGPRQPAARDDAQPLFHHKQSRYSVHGSTLCDCGLSAVRTVLARRTVLAHRHGLMEPLDACMPVPTSSSQLLQNASQLCEPASTCWAARKSLPADDRISPSIGVNTMSHRGGTLIPVERFISPPSFGTFEVTLFSMPD